jgi:calcium/proton exchanger cax
VAYVVVTYLALRRHRQLHTSDEPSDMRAWSLRTSLIVLGVATVVTAVIAEMLVHAIDVFAEDVGVSEFFLAAVVVAIVGNAAEHGGAVVVAYRGKIKLAAEIALASSAQVAVFLIPAVALLAWLIERDRRARRRGRPRRRAARRRALVPAEGRAADRGLRRNRRRVLHRRRAVNLRLTALGRP